ncbi:MAG TPA: glycosyltransferase [Candidatus Acidoferrum sp.]|nr:glycosyltransferase [Candidatus Acidoferrum sp.]
MASTAQRIPVAGAQRPNDRARRAKYELLRDVVVCHLSPVESRRDERAFTRQALPSTGYGLHAQIIGPHPGNGQNQGIELVPLQKSRSRALRILLASRFVRAALRQKADIYHVHSPELFPAALILKLIFGKRVVYDTREDFPAMMLTKTYLPARLRKLTSRIVAGAESLAARFADGFLTADSGTLRPHAKTGKSRKLVFYNFPNLQYFPEPGTVEKKFDLVYRGGLSERAGTYVLLKAVRLLKERGTPVRLLMFGYSDNKQAEQMLRDAVLSLGIECQVTLQGVIRHDDMAATLSQARIAVCPLQRIPKFLNNIPVKVFESWACGLPVIATDLPPIRPFFGNRPYGTLVKAGDSYALANAIAALLKSPQRVAEYGRQARRAVVERYNNDLEIHKLLNFYKGVMSCQQGH